MQSVNHQRDSTVHSMQRMDVLMQKDTAAAVLDNILLRTVSLTISIYHDILFIATEGHCLV